MKGRKNGSVKSAIQGRRNGSVKSAIQDQKLLCLIGLTREFLFV